MILRKIEAYISIGHISTAISGSDACQKAIAIIRYAIRGSKGVPLVQVGHTPSDTEVVQYMKSQIRAKKDHPNVRVIEKMIVTFPNEATEEQCREIAETYLKKLIGDSAVIGICALHMVQGNKHAHVYLLDGLESQEAAQKRAAERDASRKDGKKTRVRRRDHLRFKDLFYREPDKDNPNDHGIKMKSHIRQQWADHVNDYCRKHEIPVHYEHRSRAERGLPGDGTFHLGPQNHAMMQKIESAERYEMLTGHLVKRNLPNEGAVERAIKVIDENRAILAKRESVQNKWSMSEKITSDSINHARRQIPINMNATNENIIQIEEKTQNSVRGQTQLELFDKDPDQNISADVLEVFGVDKNNEANETFAPHVPSFIDNVTIQKKAPKNSPAIQRKPYFDKEKGFAEAIHLLGKSLLKRNRKSARRALLRASYFCSQTYGITDQDEKRNFIRGKLTEPIQRLFDHFLSRFTKAARKRIFRVKPRARS